MNITSAYMQQIDGVDDCIMAVIDGTQCQVPLTGGNRHMKLYQVEASIFSYG